MAYKLNPQRHEPGNHPLNQRFLTNHVLFSFSQGGAVTTILLNGGMLIVPSLLLLALTALLF
jgi:hypothetical protein